MLAYILISDNTKYEVLYKHFNGCIVMIFLGLLALIVGIVAYNIYSYLKVPKDLENLPTIPPLPFFIKIIKRIPFNETYLQTVKPYLDKHGFAKWWRIDRWCLVVQESSLVKEVHKKSNIFLKIRRSNKHSVINRTLGTSNIVSSNGEEWRRFRKIANPAFHKPISTQIFGECTYETINKIEHLKGDVDIKSLFQKTTLGALGKAIFNYDFRSLKNEDNKIFEIYNKMIEGMFDPIYFSFPYLEKFYLTRGRKEGNKAFLEFYEFLEDIVEKKKTSINKNEEQTKADLLSDMILASEDNKQSKKDLINNIFIFFLAGHDTTANTLTSTIAFLCKYPEIQRKAREEVIRLVGDKLTIPTLEQVNKMEYMMMLIKETMRLITTVPVVDRYVDKDYTFGNGLKVKRGTVVSIHSYGLHHDETIYDDAYEFNLERFYKESVDKDWMPFGQGTRVCMGMNFSIIEQKVIMSMLLLKYNFKFPEDKEKEMRNIKLNPIGLLAPQGLEINFEPRS